MKLAGVVDPAFAGKPLREFFPREPGIPALRIAGTLKEARRGGRFDVATMTTGSRTVQVRETLEALIAARIHVASTCEELSYPKLRAAKISAALDAFAKKRGVAILGTGVNPGFAMDGFARACTAPCGWVRAIKVVRRLDARKRRMQLQKTLRPPHPRPAVRENQISCQFEIKPPRPFSYRKMHILSCDPSRFLLS